MLQFSACGGWFKNCDYFETYARAAELGFRAVEHLGWLNVDPEKLAETTARTGVASSAVICETRDPEGQEKLKWSHGIVYEDTLPYFLCGIRETLEFCLRTGVRNIVVTTGNARNDASRRVQHDAVVRALSSAAPLLAGTDVQIVLEPLNIKTDHRGYFLDTSGEGFAIIREVDHPNVRLLYDIYHQQITEGNLIATIQANLSLIGHFHVADVPGRNQPGTGEINYKNVFAAIRESDYNGYTAFECGITEDAETVSKKMFTLAQPV